MSTTGNGTKRSFRRVKFERLPQGDQELLRKAQEALGGSYSPYSGFAVAAAVRTRSGQLITGTNVENVAFGTSTCAERSTLLSAHNLGMGDSCVAIAIIARAGEHSTTKTTAPCGECRQAIMESAHRSGVKENFRVLLATTDLSIIVATTIGDLLPFAFTPEDLLKLPEEEDER